MFEITEDSLKDLPPDLLKELSGDMQLGAGNIVLDLLEANNGKATIDQILIAVYRKHGDVWKRKMLQSVLLKLKTQSKVRFVSVKGKRGGYYEIVKYNNRLCATHKRFPCKECGTKHFDGCECPYCS